MSRKASWRVGRRSAWMVLVLMVAACGPAWGSASLLVEQPYGELAHFNQAGHSAIYLDHVCAETPLRLRACRADELGAVISRYDGVGNHDWIAIPLIPYLYAVDDADTIPSWVDKADEVRLRNAYRRSHLAMLAPDEPDGSAPKDNWYELVGSAYDRTIYGFRVETTPEQDAGLIAMFNDRDNVEHYNGFFRNCADFARTTLNHYYPHAIRRNLIANFGITSPKSVARSLAHYAHKHPDTEFDVFVIPQVKGTLPRSKQTQDVAEGLLKKYGLPLTALSPTTAGLVLAAYLGHGRFAMPKHAPTFDVAALKTGTPLAAGGSDEAEWRSSRIPTVLQNRELLTLPEASEPPALPPASTPVVERETDPRSATSGNP